MPDPTLDIIVPIYNEQELLEELCTRLKNVCNELAPLRCRVIFVNDGSADQSWPMLVKQQEREPRFALINLSRNFGHQPALTAGMAYSDADASVIMDGDLQDPPELIPKLVQTWRDGAQVVLASRSSRTETGLRRIGFDLFHRFFSQISDFDIPANNGTFSLLDRRAMLHLKSLPERHRFLPGLRAWIGFEQREVLYDRDDRAAGQPKQTFKRLVTYAMDGVFSFSEKPLRMMTWAGLTISLVGFLIATVFVIKRLTGVEVAATGFTTLVTLTLFLGGIQLTALGLLGEYLGRTYDEVKRRPLFIVRETFGIQIRDPQCSSTHHTNSNDQSL